MSYNESCMDKKIKKELKRASSKAYGREITEVVKQVISDKHLRKSFISFSKNLHGKKIRNTSNT